MMAITTNNSINVNPGFRHREAEWERNMASPLEEMEEAKHHEATRPQRPVNAVKMKRCDRT